MDKYEYNLRNEEINALIARREFQKAVAIADGIDWTKVRSVKTLCKISDLYKINKRYKEAKILLEQALNRCPTGKNIVSSLCELCIRMDDVVGAMEYYKQFVQMAPTDNNKFILLYKIYEAQEVTLDERIEVLEELKKRERIEKWCYELAYLYHRIGLTTRCVEECDDLILWFREGKYVKKAMELKMLHQQLTQSQEVLYQNMLDPQERIAYVSQTTVNQMEAPVVPDQEDVLVKTVDVGQYSTINIQRALEESIKGTLGDEEQPVMPVTEPEVSVESVPDSTILLSDPHSDEDVKISRNIVAEQLLAPMMQDTSEMTELFFNSDTGEIEIDETGDIPSLTGNIYGTSEPVVTEEEPVDVRSQVAFPDGPVKPDTLVYNKGDSIYMNAANQAAEAEVPVIDISNASQEDLMAIIDRKVQEALENAMKGQSMIPVNQPIYRAESLSHVTPPRSMQRMLSQELDGQLSLVVPESESVEKQITGQINIDDYLKSWENKTAEEELPEVEEIAEVEEPEVVIPEEPVVVPVPEVVAADLQEIIPEADEVEEIAEEPEEIIEEPEAEVTEETEAEEPAEEVVEAEPEVTEATEEAAEPEVTEATEEVAEAEPEVTEATEEVVEESAEEPALVIPDEVANAGETEEVEEPKEAEESEATEEEVEAEEPEATEEEAEAEEPEATDETDETDESEEPEEEEEEEAPAKEADSEEDTDEEGRALTDEELSLFAQFVQTKKAKQNLSKALDSISLASYTGNVFVTGDTGDEPVELAQSVVKYAKITDGNFSGKIGKVTGGSLNGKDVNATINRLANGGLIIEKAGEMNDETAKTLVKILNQDNLGVLVVMQDTKKEMNKMFSQIEGLKQIFNVHIEIEELSDDALVAYGRKYAEHMEFSIDEMGILALHTRIDEMQTSDHIVTVADVREIVDEAIDNATKFSPKHITEILFGKRYDDDDMIILKERDFAN